jgi:hypothetical protein
MSLLLALALACGTATDIPTSLLAPGLEGRDVTVMRSGELGVALADGSVVLVDATGRVRPTALQGPVRALAADGDGGVLVASDRELRFHPSPDAPPAFEVPLDAVDVVIGCDTLFAATATDLVAFSRSAPHTRASRPLAAGVRGLVLLDCGHLAAWTSDTLLRVALDGPITPIHLGAPILGVAARDGRPMVAVGAPPRLVQVESDATSTELGPLPDLHDLVFGFGGALPSEHVYLLEDGAITLLRVEPSP